MSNGSKTLLCYMQQCQLGFVGVFYSAQFSDYTVGRGLAPAVCVDNAVGYGGGTKASPYDFYGTFPQ